MSIRLDWQEPSRSIVKRWNASGRLLSIMGRGSFTGELETPFRRVGADTKSMASFVSYGQILREFESRAMVPGTAIRAMHMQAQNTKSPHAIYVEIGMDVERTAR
jgi:hypothetical protein